MIHFGRDVIEYKPAGVEPSDEPGTEYEYQYEPHDEVNWMEYGEMLDMNEARFSKVRVRA